MIRPSTYTVESVTSGHPDKVCDQISDAILDECLKQDTNSRVAAEVFGSNNLLVIGGEVSTNADFDPEIIGRNVYKNIGYSDEDLKVIKNIVQQSPDIAQGVNTGGAGDQGIMYGYATDETSEFLPLGISLVHKLTHGLEVLRKNGELTWLKPDGKAQLTIINGEVKKILISCQHAKDITQVEIKQSLIQRLIQPLFGDTSEIEILVNPTGSFLLGGFTADAGLTGRKIMVDTYGGLFPHGGGAFSGKDPTKVDRSAAYMARFVAKNIIANELAKKCLVSVSYAIGKADPLMVEIVNEKGESLDSIKERFDFRPQSIIEQLNLRQPIYSQTASYGHFGKEGLPWEQIIKL